MLVAVGLAGAAGLEPVNVAFQTRFYPFEISPGFQQLFRN
jgi:hypothetical protein